MNNHRIIGSRAPKVDAIEKVTGKTKYTADINVSDCYYGSIARSKIHHGIIKTIDIEAATASSGVIDIITYKDIPGNAIYGPIIQDRPVLAWDKVRFMGEPIALVIADSIENSISAREKIIIDIKELPPVFDPEYSLFPNSPEIHAKGNLVSLTEIQNGNLDSGILQSDIIIDESFDVPSIYHAYLETEAALGEISPEGNVVVTSCLQKPFETQKMISDVLGLPKENIEVKVATIGGGFGGKDDSILAILAALGSWKTKRPVKIVNTRAESLVGHIKRHKGKLKYKAGFKSDGTLNALYAKVFLDTGAYADNGPPVAQLLTEAAASVYKVPNIKIETYLAYTNTSISGAMRGFGAPQSNFAIESIMDMAAKKLGLSPYEIRLKNIYWKGNLFLTGVKLNQAESIYECLNAVNKKYEVFKVSAKQNNDHVEGCGMAMAIQSIGLGYGVPDDSTNSIECLADGNILVHVGSPDLGQGLKTVSAMVVSESLGIGYENVFVDNINTLHSPDGGVCCASRMTYCVGNSLILAAEKFKQELIHKVSLYLGHCENSLSYRDGFVIYKNNDREKSYSIPDISSLASQKGERINCLATFSFPYIDTPSHLPFGMPHTLFSYTGIAVKVSVDTRLGLVKVTEVYEVNDSGKIINRTLAEGQVEGGVVMNIGYALSEDYKRKTDGKWVDSFSEYLIPTAADSPTIIESLFIENIEPSGPFGAKGLGEAVLVPVASAIANAIYDATGVRVFSLPVTPETIISAQKE